MKRAVKAVAILFGLWLVACVVISYAYGSKMRARLEARLGEPLQATTTMAALDLAMLRGHMDIADLKLLRDKGGHLAIDVGHVTCELPPLGWALVDDDCRDLVIKTMRVEVSSAGVFQLAQHKQVPVHARHVTIEDARLEFSPSALVPDLGKLTIIVEHASARDTVFKTPLSWIFALETLQARLEAPGGIVVTLRYDHGKLTIGGGLLGTALELPVAIPVQDLADDPKAELGKLGALGKQIGNQVAKSLEDRAGSWIKSKL